jgi:hypothetical protein
MDGLTTTSKIFHIRYIPLLDKNDLKNRVRSIEIFLLMSDSFKIAYTLIQAFSF